MAKRILGDVYIKSMNIISVHFNTVKPRLTATSSVNKNGHFCLAALQNGHTCTFSRKKTLVNTAKCFWPIGDRINGVLP